MVVVSSIYVITVPEMIPSAGSAMVVNVEVVGGNVSDGIVVSGSVVEGVEVESDVIVELSIGA